jgi:Tol biopolymer transport system component
MPVHRHQHDRMGSVYAFRSELDAWASSRAGIVAADSGHSAREPPAGATDTGPESTPIAAPPRVPRRTALLILGMAGGLTALAALWIFHGRTGQPEDPLAGARLEQLTDFEGVAQAAAISRDGRFVAFQSDRDGRMDVWLTQLGTGRFTNLTRGPPLELVNPSVRTLGFSPDGSLVTFWTRKPGAAGQPEIGIWAVPLLGGPPRPYLEGAAELDWSADGDRLVFHTPGQGDPMFVRSARSAEARQIFSAPAGLHSHFVLWSPDQAFLYFVQGAVPEPMDLWRIPAGGGSPERLSRHESQVSHPVFLDPRTLLYLVTDADGSGPWLQTLDLVRNRGRRLGSGLDRYSSLSASADGRRIVATRVNPTSTLWRVPLQGGRADLSAAQRIPLSTGKGTVPRLGPDYLLYVSSSGTSDGLWKLQAGTSTELWSGPEARIVGAPAIERAGRRVAFSIRQRGRTVLMLVNADGTGARSLGGTLEPQGSPGWAPDGRTLTVAAVRGGASRLMAVPVDAGPAAPLSGAHGLDPVWSPAGDLLAYSGSDIGTTFPLHVVRADGSPSGIAPLTLTRGARHVAFTPQGRSLLVLRGEIGHKSLWQMDLESGAGETVVDLPPEFELRDFDLSPDGRELVLEQLKEHSDLVLIERPPP